MPASVLRGAFRRALAPWERVSPAVRFAVMADTKGDARPVRLTFTHDDVGGLRLLYPF